MDPQQAPPLGTGLSFLVVGVNHQTCPIDAREVLHRRVTYPHLRSLAGRLPPWDDLILLATCSRVETYALAPSPKTVGALLLDLYCRSVEPRSVYVHRGPEAVEHLFRVASGLESLAQGEVHIAEQVRRAPNARPVPHSEETQLSRLFLHAYRTAPRIRDLAGLGDYEPSASYAAVAFVKQVVPLDRARTALVGTGRMARLAAEGLRGRTDLVVLDRNRFRAEAVARALGGTGAGLDGLKSELGRADLVLAAAASRRALIGPHLLRSSLPRRHGRPLWLVDLGFPRNVDPRCAAVPGVTLVDMDSLAPWGEQALTPVARVRAEAFIHEEAARFLEAVRPSREGDVALFRRTVELMRRHEAEEAPASLREPTEADRAAVDRLASRLLNRVLHGPTAHLRSLPEKSRIAILRELVRRLNEASR